MMASGQFGGNVYRAQQVYSANMTNIIGQSMKVVADISLQYRQAAEQQRLTFSHQQLNSYIQASSVVMGSMIDMAKSYAMIRADMTVNKNNSLTQILQLKIRAAHHAAQPHGDIPVRQRAAGRRGGLDKRLPPAAGAGLGPVGFGEGSRREDCARHA